MSATLLGAGLCYLQQDDQEIVLERDIGSETRIFRDTVKQLSDPGLLTCIEIYSQGELQKIAEDGFKRLELIDRPNQTRISQLIGGRRSKTDALKQIGNEIRTLKGTIEARRAEPKMLEQYKAELVSLEGTRPSLSPQIAAERIAFDERKAVLGEVTEFATRWSDLEAYLNPWFEAESDYRQLAAKITEVAKETGPTLAAQFTKIADALRQIRGATSSTQGVDEALQGFIGEIEHQNENYYSLRKGQEVLNQALRKEDQLRQQIATLERSVADLLQLNTRLANLKQRRNSVRGELAKINDEIFNLRVNEVDRVNSVNNDRVLLTLRQGTYTDSFREKLSQLLSRSRLRNQDEIAVEISRKIRPADLVDAVEQGDSVYLADILERDVGQMTRLVGFLVDNPELYGLETEIFEDELEITLYDEGVAKRVDQLSKGQKATAILPLILREAPYPLIFDQPEDDLDNRFIFDTLVERVRHLKLTRQLVFVTHNANIPVLGDADRVIVMRMATPTRATPPTSGTVDEVKNEILSLLEGGAAAFLTRQERYGSLLREYVRPE